ncbi:MAG: hypothetical protein WC389_15660 [Lutibacter sp.]|jgi:hypothetical protein
MWTIIIGLSIGLIASILIVISMEGKYADAEDYILSGLICLVISVIISTVIAFSLPVQTKEVIDEFEIVTLQDNSQTEGNFFLGCGYINGTMKYVFYYKSDKSYKLFMVNYYSAEIIITNKKAFNQQIRTVKTDALINKFALDFYLSENRYVFYVPEGTIKQNYSLDAH